MRAESGGVQTVQQSVLQAVWGEGRKRVVGTESGEWKEKRKCEGEVRPLLKCAVQWSVRWSCEFERCIESTHSIDNANVW
jgi:hypothetical protein